MGHTSRILSVLALLLLSDGALGVPPPDRPLPPCENEDGDKVGACPVKSPEVDGSSVGRISENYECAAYVDPQVPACHAWNANSDGSWVPTPCYPAVETIRVAGCAYLDIRNDRFVEANCASALYNEVRPPSGDLFKVKNGPTGLCGGAGAFSVYYYGGPATQPDKIWSAAGPNATKCTVTLLGPRPDGLYGPTWVKLRAGIEVVTGPTSYGGGLAKWSEFYVPVDGDLRDIGPVAGFDVGAIEGGRVTFANTSIHTAGETMTYRWSFGDGETSTTASPEHRYTKAGTYKVTLTARDQSGDEDDLTISVKVDLALVVRLTHEPRAPQVGEEMTVTLEVENPFDENVDSFGLIGGPGLRSDPAFMMQTEGPTPAVPEVLGGGEVATFTFTLVPLAAGRSTLEGGALGRMEGVDVGKTVSIDVVVPARLRMELTSTVDSQTRVGDEFDVVATLTNDEEVELTGIKAEPLSLNRSDLVELVSGPLSVDGSDPRVSPMTLGAGESTTVTWRYKAIDKGVVAMKANVSGRDPNTDELFFVSREKRVAIESGAIEVVEVRLSPGSPVPGDTGLIRGIVRNIGTVDVTGLEVSVEATPEIAILEVELAEIPPERRPEKALLAVDEEHEFLIPFIMTTEADGLGSYRFEVKFTGKVEVDGEEAEVDHLGVGGGGLDLTLYWSNLLEDYLKAYLDDTLDFFEGINSFGESSTIGGIAVGGGQGVLGAFKGLGDGILGAGEIAVNTVTGEYKLTERGQQIAQTLSEYYQTHTLKEMGADIVDAGLTAGGKLDDVAIAGVDLFARWMQRVDKAYQKGDAREVSRLLSEAATNVAFTVGGEIAVEKAASQVFAKLIPKAPKRKTVGEMRAARTEDVVDLPPGERVLLETEDIKDLPTGVPLARSAARRAGYDDKTLDWMQATAKEHGVAFFARPRPAAAAKFADAGWNPKPMAIKFKSVNDIDVKWLGYDDYGGKEGLVVLRPPKPPWKELQRAIDAGEIKWGSQEIDAIIERYQRRKAEWQSVRKTLDDLNAKNGGEGFEILRDGKKIKTKAYLDDDGLMRFTHDNNPVYSDVDLMQIGRPDGKPIPKELHEKIVKAAGPGFDMQHGDTFSTSDFPSWEKAVEFVEEYGREHMRGGDPLLIVGSDAITTGYVKGFEYPETVAGSGYDLFGQVTVNYEGAYWP